LIEKQSYRMGTGLYNICLSLCGNKFLGYDTTQREHQ